MVNTRVICMMIFVNMRVRRRYTTESNIAAAVMRRRRYTVLLRVCEVRKTQRKSTTSNLFSVTPVPVLPFPSPPPKPPWEIHVFNAMPESAAKPKNLFFWRTWAEANKNRRHNAASPGGWIVLRIQDRWSFSSVWICHLHRDLLSRHYTILAARGGCNMVPVARSSG